MLIAVAELKWYKSSGNDQISADLIEAEGGTLLSEVHKLFHSIFKEELLDQ
jgi:hypothetical protein